MSDHRHNLIACIIIIIIYYSHIFPDSRAHHCNYATLLAGNCMMHVTRIKKNFSMVASMVALYSSSY